MNDEQLKPGRPNIMLVDDEAGIRAVLTLMLEGEFNVFPCSSAAQAKEVIFATTIDVAILDISMPGESGIELLQAIKESSPLVECIMLTGYETLEYTKTALHFGACEFLTKPFSSTDLLQTVARALVMRADKTEASQSKSLVVKLTKKLEATPEVFLNVQDGVLRDVRNSIDSLSVYAEMLSSFINGRDSLDTQDFQSFRERFKLIHEHAENARDVLQRHMKIANGFKEEGSVTDMRTQLEDAVVLMARHDDASRTRFTVDIEENAPAPALSEAAFLQVVMNLLLISAQSCAIEQTVQLTARRAFGPQTVPEDSSVSHSVGELSPQPGKMWLVIEITDEGRPLPTEALERLAGSFIEESGPARGLKPVIAILRSSGGALTLQRNDQVGNRVILTLPANF